jgi:hypothetical protein
MSSYLRQKYKRGRYILQKEGLFPFLVKGVRFGAERLFIRVSYYMFEIAVNDSTKLESKPKIQNFAFETILTGQRLNELVAQGFDFGVHIFGAEERLNHGAIMSCVFVGEELACIHWAAATQKTMNILTEIPYKVDFPNSEAYLGWSETNPKYRRLHLSSYLYWEEKKFLVTMGKTTGRTLVEKSNFASLNCLPKAGGRIYGEGRYLKILWWKSWKGRPIIREQVSPSLLRGKR